MSSPIINESPVNSIFSLSGASWLTYSMIGAATIGLACVTMLDDSNTSFAKDQGFFNTLQTSSALAAEPAAEPEPAPAAAPEPEPAPEETKGGNKRNRQTKSNIQKYKHNKSKRIISRQN